jgi:hypothetical protein
MIRTVGRIFETPKPEREPATKPEHKVKPSVDAKTTKKDAEK